MVELETTSGKLTVEEAKGLNLLCEFDGSLRETPDQRREDVLGSEYVTGVLKGDSGMFQLQKICNMLSQKCTIGNKAGLHVHIGSINFSKENIVYFYILGLMLQDEIYDMLPKSRKKNVYCKKLKKLDLNINNLKNAKNSIVYDILIDEYFKKIFRYVSGGIDVGKNNNKLHNHPAGSKCGYNKDAQRYCWLNFVTAMFNTKGSKNAMTLEFRNHSSTLNYEKIKNWVKICMAFVAFTENYKKEIRNNRISYFGADYPICLNSVINAVYPKTGKNLIKYIDDRKAKFLDDCGDIEKLEYETDKKGVKQMSIKEATLCV